MKKILLFGAGKSATCLIRYLVEATAVRNWQLVVAESNLSLAQSKIGAAPHATAVALQVENESERNDLVCEADIVISLLPPALHFLVAGSCLALHKDLLTASYLDDKIKALEPAIRAKGLLFLCEMGLDPGIDHMSAMQLIHRVKGEGGRILSFRSHTGGLVAPESDDNPWHYKISWNPRNVVLAGSAGASYKEDGRIITRSYEELFEKCAEVRIEGLAPLAWYPNRDSLSYIPVYGLEEAATFIRTTLRYPSFCHAWKSIVRAGLTDDKSLVRQPSAPAVQAASSDNRGAHPDFGAGDPSGKLDFAAWSAPVLPYVGVDNRQQLAFLGLFDQIPVPPALPTSADILQYLLETRLAMRSGDKDMIVMLHEIVYTAAEARPSGPTGSDPVAPARKEITSSLIVKGEDHLLTAMAKTVGLPLGIAAILILEGKMKLKGLHIPIVPEIYDPVLRELAGQGIRFTETEG